MEKPKQYGQCVSSLRSQLGFTQKQFADMLGCDQAMISKIESGTILYGEVVHQSAWKLGFHVEEFVGATGDDFYTAQQTKRWVRKYVDKRKYVKLDRYMSSCWKKPYFQNDKGFVFLNWNQGIVELHHKRDPNAAKEFFEEALRLATRFETLFNQIEIINSYAIVFYESADWETALHYLNHAKDWLSILDPSRSPQISARILYNLANTHFQLRQYEEAKDISFQAIQICKENKSTYLRGEVTYQHGYSCYRLGLKDKAKKYLEQSILFFMLEAEEELAKRAIQTLVQLEF